MSSGPEYAALTELLAKFGRVVDTCGYVTLTSEQARVVRSLGFPDAAGAGRWKVPNLPVTPEALPAIRDPRSEMLESENVRDAVGEVVARHDLHTGGNKRQPETQTKGDSEAAVTAEAPASPSDSDSKPLAGEEGQRAAEARVPELAQKVFQGVGKAARRTWTRRNEKKPWPFTTTASPGTLVFTDRQWENLRYKGKKLRRWLEENRPPALRGSPLFSRLFQDQVWQGHKQMCAEEGNWWPWLIWYLEPQYSGSFERHRPRRPTGSDPFDDMAEPFRSRARMIFHRLCEKWDFKFPDWRKQLWRKPILVGRARWLAVRRPDSAWGRSMLAKRSGYAVQEKYRQQGHHPLGLTMPRQEESSSSPNGTSSGQKRKL